MAAPIDTSLTGEIWHLSIEDLLAPLPQTIRLGGPGPFVINLSTSSAPIASPLKSMAGCEHAHMYQVQRTEDGRPRYRLRIGPFATEDEAVAILKRVREIYPCALTATADTEDMRMIAALPPRAQAPSIPPVTPPKPAAGPSIPPVTPPKPAARPAAPVVPCVNSPPVLTREQSVPVQQRSSRLPDFESTQTVRALTQLELADEQGSRWFVIQLSLAEDAFDPETVPNLDIFSVYRLYSVAGIDQGRIVHALRLGFFSEEVAAAAVAGYLTEFYDKPSIKRVSSAERQRFAEQPLEPRKDVGATGKHAVIEITSERFVRERRSSQPAGK